MLMKCLGFVWLVSETMKINYIAFWCAFGLHQNVENNSLFIYKANQTHCLTFFLQTRHSQIL